MADPASTSAAPTAPAATSAATSAAAPAATTNPPPPPPPADPAATGVQGQEDVLEADDAHELENDSSYGDDGAASSTTSITSSVMNYTYENGRRYHAFREGEYVLPNDEAEQDRLDLLHHVWKLLLDGRLYLAPVDMSKVHRVLDVGTGTGIWAIDFADEFPQAVITGTDLSPIQPPWVPPNCKFIVDDCEATWTVPASQRYDFIHARAMGGSIKSWPAFFAEIYKNLNPGGWVEIQEYETLCRGADDPGLARAPHVSHWQDNINMAADSFGKKMNPANDHKQNLIDAGFANVVDDPRVCPIGPWPKNKKLKEIGRYELCHMLDAVEPYSLALLTRVLKWDRTRIEALGVGVRREMKDPTNHMYSYFHFIYAQKPAAA